MNQPAGNQRDFLGVGWKFPLQVTPGGQIAQARYEQRIEESIYLILSTSKGERVMLPEFGCGIHDLVFAPNNSTTIAVVVQTVREALVAFEPRIDVLDISAESAPEEPNLLLIQNQLPDSRQQRARQSGLSILHSRKAPDLCRWKMPSPGSTTATTIA